MKQVSVEKHLKSHTKLFPEHRGNNLYIFERTMKSLFFCLIPEGMTSEVAGKDFKAKNSPSIK